jgi:hypothetical protein
VPNQDPKNDKQYNSKIVSYKKGCVIQLYYMRVLGR